MPIDSNGFPNSNPSAIDVDQNSEVWVTFSAQAIPLVGYIPGGISVYNGINWQTKLAGGTSTQLPDIFIDSDNVKWIASDNGLLMFYDINNSQVFSPNNSGILSLDIRKIAEDSNEVLWITTGDGLAKYKRLLDTN